MPLDLTKMSPLERQFHQETLDGCEVLKKKHKYNPTYFLGMVDSLDYLRKRPMGCKVRRL